MAAHELIAAHELQSNPLFGVTAVTPKSYIFSPDLCYGRHSQLMDRYISCYGRNMKSCAPGNSWTDALVSHGRDIKSWSPTNSLTNAVWRYGRNIEYSPPRTTHKSMNFTLCTDCHDSKHKLRHSLIYNYTVMYARCHGRDSQIHIVLCYGRDSKIQIEQLIELHAEAGHFLNELESLSGVRSLESQDFEIASGMLLGEGSNPHGQTLVAEDGSLMSLHHDRDVSQVRVTAVTVNCHESRMSELVFFESPPSIHKLTFIDLCAVLG
jgi:hypothetical protein